MDNKILVLPEIIENLKWWWSYWVSRKIYLADKNKHFDYIQEKNQNVFSWINKNSNKSIISISKIIPRSLELILYYIKEILKNYFFLKKNIGKHHYFISNNILQTFSLLLIRRKKIKLIYVHHLNGDLYNQTITFNWIERSFILKLFCFIIEKFVFNNSKIIWFPSKWSLEQYPNKKWIDNKKIDIFYNWVDIIKNNLHKNKIIDKIELITINTAIDWTWVDRIPLFLKQLKDNDIKFHWTFVWIWPLTYKIEEYVKNYNLTSNVTLIFEKIDHKLIIEKLKYSNFYLWFHRISIFDFTILEAMSQWCIPILTNVWWNKDFIIDNNWLLISENELNESWDKFSSFLNNINFEEISEKNISIIDEFFSTENFFNKYKKISNEL